MRHRNGPALPRAASGYAQSMDVTIIGTGNMARGIGKRLVAGGHDVTVLGKQEADAQGVVDDLGGSAKAGATSSDAIAGDVVVLALYFADATAVVEQHGDALDGRVLIDITNPVNESVDGLVTPPDGSAAQEIARAAPGARVVKAFNTTFARTLAEGEVGGQPLDVFLAADDTDAKQTAAQLVEDGGLRPIDAGPLARARELEAAGLLHMTVQGTLGTGFGTALKVLDS